MARRFFGVRQRVGLYLASGGECAACGVELREGWHADHVVPWCRGGETDVVNGQALCPGCNLSKGGGALVQQWPESVSLRTWQELALDRWRRHPDPDFLAVATPGAGKTVFALRGAHEELASGRVSRVVVVCPTEHLKVQWAEAAARVGIAINPAWTNGDGVAGDYHGVAVTYAQVASAPDLHRHACRRPTMAVFDEIHHAGDGKSWGKAIRHAYEPAARRLSLSGTPFRSDDDNIPFVRYEDDPDEPGRTRSRADFAYGYADALADDVCRMVFFPSYEGQMEWLSRVGRAQAATFRDDLGQRLAAERLKTALVAHSGMMVQMVADAVRRLESLRAGHPDAAGLVVARDVGHAKEIAGMMRRQFRIDPIVVTSEDADASERIARFAASDDPWIVAVKMVSEGVDIPRLRVGVYATNVLTEMYFRQAVGRFVRVIPGVEEQSAYLFIPRDPTLIGYAQAIKDERDHEIQREADEDLAADPGGDGGDDDRAPGLYIPISATGQADDVFFDHQAYTQDELRRARAILSRAGAPPSYEPTIVARILRVAGVAPAEAAAVATATAEPAGEPLHVRKDKMRKTIKRLRTIIVNTTDGAVDHADVGRRLIEIDGNRIEECTLDQLQARIDHLVRWRQELADGV